MIVVVSFCGQGVDEFGLLTTMGAGSTFSSSTSPSDPARPHPTRAHHDHQMEKNAQYSFDTPAPSRRRNALGTGFGVFVFLTAAAPFDRVRILMQTQGSSTQLPAGTITYPSVRETLRKVTNEEGGGGLVSLWRG